MLQLWLSEQQVVSGEAKMRAVEELQQRNHEHSAFFVCRNPVEKMLSSYEHFQADMAAMFDGVRKLLIQFLQIINSQSNAIL